MKQMKAATKSPKSSRRAERLRKSERNMNQAAEGVIGLNPLVGVSPDDFGDSMKSTVRQVAKQPLVAAKHTLGYAGKLVDVVAGKTDYTVARRDRRFADTSWQESGMFRGLLQGYLALDESYKQWVEDLDLDELDERKVSFFLTS
jgi:polyhydroxyalkanoate synthase